LKEPGYMVLGKAKSHVKDKKKQIYLSNTTGSAASAGPFLK